MTLSVSVDKRKITIFSSLFVFSEQFLSEKLFKFQVQIPFEIKYECIWLQQLHYGHLCTFWMCKNVVELLFFFFFISHSWHEQPKDQNDLLSSIQRNLRQQQKENLQIVVWAWGGLHFRSNSGYQIQNAHTNMHCDCDQFTFPHSSIPFHRMHDSTMDDDVKSIWRVALKIIFHFFYQRFNLITQRTQLMPQQNIWVWVNSISILKNGVIFPNENETLFTL